MNPIIFQTKFFTLHTFWIFFAIATLTGTYALIRLTIRNGLKLQFLSDNSTKLLIATLIGARVIAVIENYRSYFYELSFSPILNFFAVWDRNLSLWGAVAGFLICLHYLCKKSDQDWWKWLDTIVPSLILAMAIGHIGNFFAGINYGNETSLPWGVNFDSPAIKYAVPIHPTQIYAFIYSSLIALALVLVSQTEKVQKLEKSGFIGILGAVLYSLLSFLEGFLRGDDTLTIFDIRVSQILAFTIFIAASTLLYKRYPHLRLKQPKR